MKGMRKISMQASFVRALNYVFTRESSKQALPGELIGGNMISLDQDIAGFAEEFEIVEALRPDVGKKVWHESLRLPPGETMPREKWVAFADEFMLRMGFDPADNHPRLYVLHDDIDENGVAGQHIHIVASRVGFGGELHRSHDQSMRATKIISDLEREFGLTITKSVEYDESGKPIKAEQRYPRKNELERMKRTGQPSSKEYITHSINSILKENKKSKMTFATFQETLKTLGVETIVASNKTGVSGISFKYDGVAVAGSKLGEKFKWSRLSSNFEDLGISAIRSNDATRKREMQRSIVDELMFMRRASRDNRHKFRRGSRANPNPLTSMLNELQLLVLEFWAQVHINMAYAQAERDYKKLNDELQRSLIRQAALEGALAEMTKNALIDTTPRETALQTIRSELYRLKNGIATKSKLSNLLAQATRLGSADDVRLLVSHGAPITAESIKLAAASSDPSLLGLLKGALENDQIKHILASESIDDATKAKFVAAKSLFTESAASGNDQLNKKFMTEKIREFLKPVPGEPVISFTELLALLNSQGIEVKLIVTKSGPTGLTFKHDGTVLSGSDLGDRYRWGRLSEEFSYDKNRDAAAIIRCKPALSERANDVEVTRVVRPTIARNTPVAKPGSKPEVAQSRARSAAERSNDRRMRDVLAKLKDGVLDSFTPDLKTSPAPRRLQSQGFKKSDIKAPDLKAPDALSSPDRFKSGIRKPVPADPRRVALERVREHLIKIDTLQPTKATHQTLLAEATRLESLDDFKLVLSSIKQADGAVSAENIKLAAKTDPVYMSLLSANLDADRIDQMLKMRWLDDDEKAKLRVAVGMKPAPESAEVIANRALATEAQRVQKVAEQTEKLLEKIARREKDGPGGGLVESNLLEQAVRIGHLAAVKTTIGFYGPVTNKALEFASKMKDKEIFRRLKGAMEELKKEEFIKDKAIDKELRKQFEEAVAIKPDSAKNAGQQLNKGLQKGQRPGNSAGKKGDDDEEAAGTPSPFSSSGPKM